MHLCVAGLFLLQVLWCVQSLQTLRPKPMRSGPLLRLEAMSPSDPSSPIGDKAGDGGPLPLPPTDARIKELRAALKDKLKDIEKIERELVNFVSPVAATAAATATTKTSKSKSSSGYKSMADRKESGDSDTVPPSAIKLACRNFLNELQLLFARSDDDDSSRQRQNESPELMKEFKKKVSSLTLSNDAIWARENSRPPVRAPWVLKAPYYFLCLVLDRAFEGRPINRLYFLETVARMPYFSYITMLHTYETIGWWRRSEVQKRIHFAEELNEFNHLKIMEHLGGDQDWSVRFLAQHASIVYYFTLLGLWILSPTLAYGFSELIEEHAVDTYLEFAHENEAILKSMEVPECAKQYWEGEDMFFFDEFQSQKEKGTRRPKLLNLHDVFIEIAADESEHAATMRACQDPETRIKSPNTEAAILTVAALALTLAAFPINLEPLTDPVVDAASSAVGGLAGLAGGESGLGEEGSEVVEVAPSLLRQLSQWADTLKRLL